MPNSLNTWTEFKKRKWIVLLVGVGLIPVMTVASELEQPLELGVFIAYAALFLFLGAWTTRWLCPRCKRSFIRRGAYGNIFTRKCMNCGLRVGAEINEIQSDDYKLR